MKHPFISDVSEEEMARERSKASEARRSQWWKNRKAKGLCYYCRKHFHPSGLTMDHVVPLVRGGKSTKSNMVTCCKDCNNKKKHMLPLEWEEYMSTLV